MPLSEKDTRELLENVATIKASIEHQSEIIKMLTDGVRDSIEHQNRKLEKVYTDLWNAPNSVVVRLDRLENELIPNGLVRMDRVELAVKGNRYWWRLGIGAAIAALLSALAEFIFRVRG